MKSSPPFLELRNISKDFFGNRVLKEVSFSLRPGEILGLVGENGAGKSTLMKILFGMNVIHSTGGYGGTILLDGAPVRFASPFEALDAGIGMVHQEFSLLPEFTAAENILLNRESVTYNPLVEVFGDRLKTLDRPAMRDRARKALSRLGGPSIDEGMRVAEMPVGHKQFTEIARELDREKILLLVLDEPTAVLTESEAEILLASIRKLADQGIAVIFISHRLKEVLEVADRVVVLRDGGLVHQAEASETGIAVLAEKMVGREVGTVAVRNRESPSTGTVLEVENLWVDMPGETVRKVSFSVRKGEIFGIGGLAGQGKLGIPNGIMGLFPAGGRVLFEGSPVPLGSPKKALDAGLSFVSEDRRGVGLLLEEPLDWNIVFTAMQNQNRFLRPLLGGLVRWRDDKAIAAAAQEYVRRLDIKCTGVGQRAQELSGGNQQKVCLAKAFISRPRLLFVSEPTRGIDVGAKKLVLDTLRMHNEEYGTTIVMVSSELEELKSVCDRIAIVDEGRVAGILPPSARAGEFGMLMAGKAGKDGNHHG